MSQGIRLLSDGLFETILFELMPCLLLIPHQSVCTTEQVLKQLEVILGKLMIQITENRDRANSYGDVIVP